MLGRGGRLYFAYSIDVLEHIENDKLALTNIYNALKKGGKFLIHVPLVEEHIFQKVRGMPIKKTMLEMDTMLMTSCAN